MDTLAAWVRRHGALTTTDAVGWTVRLAKSLEALHARGLTHGRVSARAVSMADEACTSAGVLAAPHHLPDDVAYHSPERALGSGSGPDDDTWAVGVFLYFALTGVVPFPGADDAEVRERIAWRPASPLLVYEVGNALLQALIDRLFAPADARRLTSVAELKELLVAEHPAYGMLEPLGTAGPGTGSVSQAPEEEFDEEEATMIAERPRFPTIPVEGPRRAPHVPPPTNAALTRTIIGLGGGRSTTDRPPASQPVKAAPAPPLRRESSPTSQPPGTADVEAPLSQRPTLLMDREAPPTFATAADRARVAAKSASAARPATPAASRPPTAAAAQAKSRPPATAAAQPSSRPPTAAAQAKSKPPSAAAAQPSSRPPTAAVAQAKSRPPTAAAAQPTSKPPAAPAKPAAMTPVPVAAKRLPTSAGGEPARAKPRHSARDDGPPSEGPSVEVTESDAPPPSFGPPPSSVAPRHARGQVGPVLATWRRQGRNPATVPLVALALVGAVVGGYFALRGGESTPAPGTSATEHVATHPSHTTTTAPATTTTDATTTAAATTTTETTSVMASTTSAEPLASASAVSSAAASSATGTASASASASAPPTSRPIVPAGGVNACLVALFPEGTFQATPQLDFVCTDTDPYRSAQAIRAAVVAAGSGRGATAGKREWARLGWYKMAALAIGRARCCSQPLAFALPPSLAVCKLDEALATFATAVLDGDDAAVATANIGFKKATACLKTGGAAAFFGNEPQPSSIDYKLLLGVVKRVRAAK